MFTYKWGIFICLKKATSSGILREKRGNKGSGKKYRGVCPRWSYRTPIFEGKCCNRFGEAAVPAPEFKPTPSFFFSSSNRCPCGNASNVAASLYQLDYYFIHLDLTVLACQLTDYSHYIALGRLPKPNCR